MNFVVHLTKTRFGASKVREGLMDSAQAHQQCLEKLIWAMRRLEVQVDWAQLYTIADLIVQPMTGYWRYFHTPQHVIEVGGNEDGIEVLAALFHDLVYVQVDCSINFNLSYYITPFVKQEREQLRIRETFQLPADPTFEMVVSVFGFVAGQVLDPFAGENEFLSAVVTKRRSSPRSPTASAGACSATGAMWTSWPPNWSVPARRRSRPRRRPSRSGASWPRRRG